MSEKSPSTIHLTKQDIKCCLYERPSNSHKGSYGYIGLIGGNIRYSGAIRLANMANCAMRSGAGVVKLAAPRSLQNVLLPNILESTYFPLSDDGQGNFIFNENEINELISGLSLVAVGMGIGNTENTKALIKYLLMNYEGTLIIDADGLNALSSLIHDNSDMESADSSGMESADSCNKTINCSARVSDYSLIDNARSKVIITPHPKEFSRLSMLPIDEVLNNGVNHAYQFSQNHHVITLLKGNVTHITDGKTIYQVDRGCPGMATAGSGDVLSGIIAAVCGYNKDKLLLATATAAYIAGFAGQIAQEKYGAISMVASDTANHIAAAIKELSE